MCLICKHSIFAINVQFDSKLRNKKYLLQLHEIFNNNLQVNVRTKRTTAIRPFR